MFKNYLMIAFRNIRRNKGYSFINIAGLAIGMACFILISLWVRDELSYDRFHEHKDRIFKVITKTNTGDVWTTSSWALGPALKERYPDIVEFSRVWFWHRSLVRTGDKRFVEQNFYLADPSIFTMFTFPFVKGDPETSLANMNSIVITEETARRYFGEDDPLGQVLHVVSYQSDFIVTGVIKNIPENSHMQFDLVARIELMGQQRLESWEFTGYSYVMLSPDVPVDEVNQKISNFYREVIDPELTATPILQPLTRIHLYETGEPGIIKQVAIFSVIAVFILIIACINFMNLNTAKSARRAREVGMRKVTGASRIQLVKQFLGETILLSFLALAIALVLVELAIPVYNGFTGKNLSVINGVNSAVVLILICIAPLTGILAGSYPAIFLSSFQPAYVLNKQFSQTSKGALFRKILIIFQFSVSIGLFICTTVVYKQLHLVQKKDLGFDREFVVTMPNNPDLRNRFDTFKNELLREEGILNVTAAASRPTEVGQSIAINWEGNAEEEFLPIGYTMVDYDFFETFDMEFVQGRSFSREFASDGSEACIINERAQAEMGITSPLGTRVYFAHPALEESFRYVRIIGVVKDFHFRSMHELIGPFIFRIYRPWHSYVFIKIKPENVPETLQRIENISVKFAPDYPFQYEFLDEAFVKLYQSERQMGRLFNVFGILAIFISCLGLFGLASYTAEQKTKEIGVRKVLGASVAGIVLSLSKEFTKWVLVANLVAWPVAYFVMREWLQGFAYRTGLTLGIFILSAILAFIVALITVGHQSIKAALTNPVESIKYE